MQLTRGVNEDSVKDADRSEKGNSNILMVTIPLNMIAHV